MAIELGDTLLPLEVAEGDEVGSFFTAVRGGPKVFEGLGAASDSGGGMNAGWDWKGKYVDRLNTEYGLEIFTEQSVTPDTTLLLAGPPRVQSNSSVSYHPIGLVTSVQYSQDAQLKPFWEIGSDVTKFSTGKTVSTLMIGKMLAHQDNLLRALHKESGLRTAEGDVVEVPKGGSFSPGSGSLWLNLGSEAAAMPFGILVVFKTKVDSQLETLYLEHCHLSNLSVNMDASNPVVQENVTIMFDRAVPIAVDGLGEK